MVQSFRGKSGGLEPLPAGRWANIVCFLPSAGALLVLHNVPLLYASSPFKTTLLQYSLAHGYG